MWQTFCKYWNAQVAFSSFNKKTSGTSPTKGLLINTRLTRDISVLIRETFYLSNCAAASESKLGNARFTTESLFWIRPVNTQRSYESIQIIHSDSSLNDWIVLSNRKQKERDWIMWNGGIFRKLEYLPTIHPNPVCILSFASDEDGLHEVLHCR